MRFLVRISLISIVAVWLTAVTAWGQTVSTAQINGSVLDSTGGFIPGAQVKVTQTATGLVRTATTGPDGIYVFANLPIGPYLLEISKDGFNKYVQSGIVLQVGANPTIDATLKVGSVSEQVEVHADAALVETRSTGVGTVIDNQRVLELPLNGRQATDLIFLAGMATVGNGANLNSGVRNYPTVQISIAGGLDNGVSYLLDGGTHNDPYNNLNLPLPFPDALQEFKVEASALPAQYGQHSSAAINAVTKSGTNAFHGDAFEFLRNEVLNARNSFAPTRDPLKRNQFGGTLGGPILKDKLFFFVGEQSTTKRSAPSTSNAFVPTAAMLGGDFTAVTTPQPCNTLVKPITLSPSLGFVNNQISPAAFSDPAKKLAALLPPASNACGLVQFATVQNSNEHLGLARVDYQWNPRHTVFGRYELAWLDQPTDFDGKNPLTLSQGDLNSRVHSIVLGDTYLFGPATVSSFRATFNRSKNPKTSPAMFDLHDLGVNMFVYSPKTVRLTVTNGFTIGSPSSTGSIYNSTEFQLGEDISTIRGAHQLGFGGTWVHAILNASSFLNSVGPVTFSGQITGLGLADLLMGKPSSFQQSNPTQFYPRSHYVGLYAQDTWKVMPRLTVNYGLRWEPYLPETFKNGALSHFDPTLFSQGVRSSVYVKAPLGLTFPGDPGYPGNAVANSELGHFAPRIGVAWDPQGDGRMSVRASYGIFYNLPTLGHYSGLAQIPPFGNSVTVQSPASFADPWASQPGGNPFPFILSPGVTFPAFAQGVTFPLNPKVTYQNQWNLSLQRQFGSDWLAAANYVGSNVIHLWTGGEINPGIYTAGTSTLANLNQRRLYTLPNASQGPFLGSISQMDDGGTSNYHGLLLSLQRRRARGLTVQANYTWSHCIGDLGNTSMGVAGTNYMIPFDRASSRGDCSSNSVDRRHLFNLSTVYETRRASNAVVRALASGWQISGIVRLQSGPPLSVTSGLDQALTGAAAQRTNQVLADPYPANKSTDLWLNPLAFAQPLLGTYGNLGIANIRGPGVIQVDMGLTRTFRIYEAHSLQFRWEAFNLPNHMNPSNPTTAFNSPTFGKILAAGDPRIMQAALKYTF